MKKETKKLIDWIKKQISLAGTIVTDVSKKYWQDDKLKAINFLDSLPEIESHLCRGGYVQDRNGTPCCEGDRIKITSEEGDTYGTLLWNSEKCCFDISIISTSYGLHIFDSFEKVE